MSKAEELAKSLHDMADVDFDNVLLRCAAHLRALDASHQRLKELAERWSGDGALQTFEDRERFRAAARAALEQAKGLE